MFIFWNQKFVAKKNIFSKTIFFEQSILSEVGLVSIWKESDQYNLSNERDLKHRKMIKNVSFSMVSGSTSLKSIMFIHF